MGLMVKLREEETLFPAQSPCTGIGRILAIYALSITRHPIRS